ncbi:phage portal protein [Rhizobium halophytocola]|uniref:HK97 family phage portal protein n=1 Tax=Rhizobium halophytocola TaxID=735519 RepID=A0ABS4DVH4_9HYPH|nr:phage portal protein [Rhizobium halophytocola]MBP1849685.1 HK97 family phage portal protein [Rhizobium halophytocola]
MNWLRAVFGGGTPKAATQSASGGQSYSATDPAFLEAIRRGLASGKSPEILRNGAVNRAVRLHCESIGMLPLHLMFADDAKGKATDHPVFKVLHRKPNNWQTPYEFKRLMQVMLLKNGAAYAQIVRSRDRVYQLQPLAKFRVEPKQNRDWSISYEVTNSNGVKSTLRQSDVLAIRDLDIEDGVSGSSRIDQAHDAIGITSSIKKAVQKLFDNGLHAGGVFESGETKLTTEQRQLAKDQIEERSGAVNAGRWLILENMKAKQFELKLGDNQQVENLGFQIQEVGRIFGAPRPLLMMDDTSWGSGIEALGQFFVTYGLAPQFTNWEQAISRDLLTDDERDEYDPKFNERALLRGSMKDQADFFTKALGAGGGMPWMTVPEVRGLSDLPKKGSDELPERLGATTGATNDPQKPA